MKKRIGYYLAASIICIFAVVLVIDRRDLGESVDCTYNLSELDKIVDKIKDEEFEMGKLCDQDFDKVNKIISIVKGQSLAGRKMLIDDDGNNTQRILQYKLQDGSLCTILIGAIKSREGFAENDLICSYVDGLIYETEDEYVQSAVLLYNGCLINLIVNHKGDKIDRVTAAKFKEEVMHLFLRA